MFRGQFFTPRSQKAAVTNTVHNPDQYMFDFKHIISHGRKKIGILIGAGAPVSVNVGKAGDFTSQQVNTRSKQVIDRLRKHNRMKWETFYPTLQPLTYHLPKAIQEKAFAIHAFAAMIAHNLNVHVNVCGPFESQGIDCLTHGQVEHSHRIPSSELLDLLFTTIPSAMKPSPSRPPTAIKLCSMQLGTCRAR